MKLPISLLVLVAISQALSVQPLTKRSEAKSSEVESSPAKTSSSKNSPSKSSPAKSSVVESSPAKSSSSKNSPVKSPVVTSSTAKYDSQTSKRELYEGNFGERNKEVISKYEVTGPTPKIEYANELQDIISEQSPTHQIFGVRLPQIAKISDVLTGHGPSFEAALAKHLSSPVSVYQARLSSPTSFEVPTPAASQSPYSNPKAYKLQADAENEHKLQEAPPKGVEVPIPVIPVYMVNPPRLQFEAYPQPLDSGLSRQHANLPQEIFRPNQLPKKVMTSLFPIYDHLRSFRYPGQEVRSQMLHQNGVYQIIPVTHDFGFGNQEGNRDKNYHKQENHEQLKAGQSKLQIDIPVPKQGYHAHPNGAISYASFSHNLPINTQYETGLPTQQAQLQSQAIPVQQPPQIQPEVMLQSQEQKFAPLKQTFLIPSTFQRLIQDLEKHEPVYRQQPQFIPFKQQIQNQPRMLNALQQHLLFQDVRQLPNPQLIQLQRLPTFKTLPQSQLSADSFLQQTSRSSVISERSPRPFGYEDQSTKNPENFDLPLEPASTQLTRLPPLKPNYSRYVKPLEPHPHSTPVFSPTPLQPLSTSTSKLQPVSDQLISSTTIQPNVKGQEDPEEQSIQKETQLQSQTSQPLKPEITHQSQPTVRPAPMQSTTYLPFVNHEPQSIYFQYSTRQPIYQASIRPSSPRHDVVIQRQEIQELFFEPSPQPPSTLHYQNQHQVVPEQQEQEIHQLRTQPNHQLFQQLQSLQFQKEIQDINSQQYQLKASQLKSPQKQDSSQQGEHLQYLIQHHSHPLHLQNFQPKLLQSQQFELEPLQQQQLVYQAQQHISQQSQQQASEQAQQQQQASQQAQQQQQASEQAQQQQQASEQAHKQQQASEQAQQQQGLEQAQEQQQASEQAQQQRQASEQAQEQQQASEQAKQQQQGSKQAQQQQQGSELAQQQQYQHHLDTNNQIQISTLRPSPDAEKQTETEEIQQQPEPQPQLQQQLNHQPTTEYPKEQPEHLSEPTPNEEQLYVGPLPTSSDLPQIYVHQQQLVDQPEYSPLLGVPSYSDVQYFGKFAETLLGNHHH